VTRKVIVIAVVIGAACGGTPASIPSITPMDPAPSPQRRESCWLPYWLEQTVTPPPAIPTVVGVAQIPPITHIDLPPYISGEDPFPPGDRGVFSVLAVSPPIGERLTVVARNNTGETLKDYTFVVEARDDAEAIVACAGNAGSPYGREIGPGELVWDTPSFCSEMCTDISEATHVTVKAYGLTGTNDKVVDLKLDVNDEAMDGVMINSQPREVHGPVIEALCVESDGTLSSFLGLRDHSEMPMAPGEQSPFRFTRDTHQNRCSFLVAAGIAYDLTGGAARHY
jgi:hypothetical protein